MPLTPNQKKNREKGSVFVELSFVVPFLVLMLAGLYELGRYFSQVSWLSQTAYQVALVGGLYTPSATTDLRMQTRYEFLRDRIYSPLKLDLNPLQNETNLDRTNVRATITGTFKFKWLPTFFTRLPLRISVEGPILAQSTNDIGDTTRFCNWNPTTNQPEC